MKVEPTDAAPEGARTSGDAPTPDVVYREGPFSPPPSSETLSWPNPPPQPTSEGLLWRALGLLRTIRPHQWVKNVFVLAPVVFAKEFFDPQVLVHATLAFLAFCLVAGAVYTINDLADVEADRLHPVKRYRPIASGRVPEGVARTFALGLVSLSVGGAFFINPWFALVTAAYFGLNIAYTLRLKHIAYVDVSCISLGFVMRVMGGGLATGIAVSWYLYACTALLALFLGFGKRRHELTTAAARAGKQRQALEGYTRRGLDAALVGTAAATVLVYAIYTLDPETQAFFGSRTLWPTTLLVICGVARFLYLVRNRPKSESPTQEMLSDGPMVAIVLVWIGVVLWLVYRLQPAVG